MARSFRLGDEPTPPCLFCPCHLLASLEGSCFYTEEWANIHSLFTNYKWHTKDIDLYWAPFSHVFMFKRTRLLNCFLHGKFPHFWSSLPLSNSLHFHYIATKSTRAFPVSFSWWISRKQSCTAQCCQWGCLLKDYTAIRKQKRCEFEPSQRYGDIYITLNQVTSIAPAICKCELIW